jgi:hypothetical protein
MKLITLRLNTAGKPSPISKGVVDMTINIQPCKGINLITWHMRAKRASRVATVHVMIEVTIRAHLTLVHVFHADASVNNPWVAHALLKVHPGPVCVLKDWWPTIRYLTLCWEFFNVRHLKRQYERWNKFLYGLQWRKRESRKDSLELRILYFIWVLGTPYYQGGCIGWVGEV